MLAVETKNLCKYYGEHLGIEQVSLEIESGEIFGFIGPNGAGKSTTIRTILGLLTPSSGLIHIFGKDIKAFGDQIRKSIGYLPSEVNYYDEMSSRELLEYHCRFYGIYEYSKVKILADFFELDLDKKITDLSFGNKKKCGIIQSIIHDPKLLIMDEPTSGLDPLMQNKFFELLREKKEKGTTIFFSSHILSEVQNICDRAAIIKNGKITATENIQSLLQKQMKKASIIFKSKADNLAFPKGIKNPKWNGNKLSLEYIGPIDVFIKWIANLDIYDIVLEEPDLESIFINYYQDDYE